MNAARTPRYRKIHSTMVGSWPPTDEESPRGERKSNWSVNWPFRPQPDCPRLYALFSKRVSSERQSTQCALLSVIFASLSSILLLAVYMYRYGLQKARLYATPSPRQASARHIRFNSPPLVMCNLAALINMTLKRHAHLTSPQGRPQPAPGFMLDYACRRPQRLASIASCSPLSYFMLPCS